MWETKKLAALFLDPFSLSKRVVPASDIGR
jgi:hypothetical protein